ncbi:MAG TPA: mannitol dehydrogenase family protein [Lachnospiraceae bacterium]
MELTYQGIKDRKFWEIAGIKLPDYCPEEVSKKAIESPRWVHFGIGNIFRIFIGGIADDLLEKGLLDRGITCVETFDFDVIDKIYKPFDNLALSVLLDKDGSRDIKVLASFAEALGVNAHRDKEWNRLQDIFACKELQIVSLTITEKGYALYDSFGKLNMLAFYDIEQGPKKVKSAMGILASMLYTRFQRGAFPIALVSMDNCSHNGDLLKTSVLSIAKEWEILGFVEKEFVKYLENEEKVAFPWTMIDKITPRPSEDIASNLSGLGISAMDVVVTSKETYIAPFANAEIPQYLVVEDKFPNGRPKLEEGYGVYMTDRETVDKAERMKVTACLNPVHSALGPIEVVLGIDLFADGLKDEALLRLGRRVAYVEGMDVIENPGILSPKEFTDELFSSRFPNQYLGDTNLRLATDVSQGLCVRFGETVKSYVKRDGNTDKLWGIAFGIAGWLRYLLGVDDKGNIYELAPDPMKEEIRKLLSEITLGESESLKKQLQPILSNKQLFGVNLYETELGERIESLFKEMIAGKGAVRKTLDKYFGENRNLF